jgi:hypothetical protein
MEEIPVPMIAHMINFLLFTIVHLLWNRYVVLYLVSCPRKTFHNFSRFYDTLGVWGSLFSFTTIYPEVVERHHHFAYYEATPQNHVPTATGILCACPPNAVLFGGGNRLGRLLGGGT